MASAVLPVVVSSSLHDDCQPSPQPGSLVKTTQVYDIDQNLAHKSVHTIAKPSGSWVILGQFPKAVVQVTDIG